MLGQHTRHYALRVNTIILLGIVEQVYRVPCVVLCCLILAALEHLQLVHGAVTHLGGIHKLMYRLSQKGCV